MTDVNWWLMALAFILGLALTFVLMIRRVQREVPASASGADAPAGAAPAGGATSFAGGRSGAESEPATTKAPSEAPNDIKPEETGQKDDGQ
ncbi:MAG: hypothetical protein ACRDTN_18840 [Mycobacterium sp.]